MGIGAYEGVWPARHRLNALGVDVDLEGKSGSGSDESESGEVCGACEGGGKGQDLRPPEIVFYTVLIAFRAAWIAFAPPPRPCHPRPPTPSPPPTAAVGTSSGITLQMSLLLVRPLASAGEGPASDVYVSPTGQGGGEMSRSDCVPRDRQVVTCRRWPNMCECMGSW